MSGEVPRYTGIVNCFTRVSAEQGFGSFWRGNMANIVRYFPTQAFNFAFKDSIKAMFPKAKKGTFQGFMTNVASGGLAGAGCATWATGAATWATTGTLARNWPPSGTPSGTVT